MYFPDSLSLSVLVVNWLSEGSGQWFHHTKPSELCHHQSRCSTCPRGTPSKLCPYTLFFSPFLAQKILFLFLSSAPAFFFLPKKSCFSLELVNFWTLFPNFFFQFSAQKIPFFVLKLSPSLFFWKLVNFCPYTQFFPQFCAKKILFFCLSSAPAFFFWAKKVLFFFKITKFLDLILKFFPNVWPKNPFFLLKLSPSLFFLAKKVLFSFKIT